MKNKLQPETEPTYNVSESNMAWPWGDAPVQETESATKARSRMWPASPVEWLSRLAIWPVELWEETKNFSRFAPLPAAETEERRKPSGSLGWRPGLVVTGLRLQHQ